MLTPNTGHVPENHPIRLLFTELTERGLAQIHIHDEASVRYISGMMLDFIDLDAVYPIRDAQGVRLEHLTDLLAEAHKATEPAVRRDHFKHLGDLTLFMLGLFPERFRRRRRALSRDLYVAEGRRSYRIVAELVRAPSEPAVFRRLADQYERYVEGLGWVRLYIRDPFFQYMFREFGVS
jgi:hypothetical protein